MRKQFCSNLIERYTSHKFSLFWFILLLNIFQWSTVYNLPHFVSRIWSPNMSCFDLLVGVLIHQVLHWGSRGRENVRTAELQNCRTARKTIKQEDRSVASCRASSHFYLHHAGSYKALSSRVIFGGMFPFISQVLLGHVFCIRSVKGCDPGYLSRRWVI